MRILLHADERRPDPEPLRTDDRKAVLVGISMWTVLACLALIRRDALVADGLGWWLWCCVSGIVLGLAGLAFLHVREARARVSR